MKNNEIYFAIEQKLNTIFNDKSVHQQCLVHKELIKNITNEVASLYQELLDKQRKADESERFKQTFLNNISHEIRTPMNAIIGFSNLLDKENAINERTSYFSKVIQKSTLTLLNTLNDLVEFSELTSSKPEIKISKFYPNEILEELENEFLEKGIEFKIQKKIPLTTIIQSDKKRLKLAIIRLIDNALKFTNSGYIKIGYKLENNCVIFYVKDTGIGINEKNRKLIFESFKQVDNNLSRNFGGLGIGLSIVNENVKLLQKKIIFESEMNKGTCFYLTIPIKVL